MKLNHIPVIAVALALSLSGCVSSIRGVADKKPTKPMEHVILFFGIPVYWSSDSSHTGCCGEHGSCPVHDKGRMAPMPPHSFHGKPGSWGKPGDWGSPKGKKDDCCAEHGPAKKMDCCERKEGEKKMECCEHKEGEKKMECCEEGAKGKPAATEHDHSSPDAAKKK